VAYFQGEEGGTADHKELQQLSGGSNKDHRGGETVSRAMMKEGGPEVENDSLAMG
jgi:hypothetical protein